NAARATANEFSGLISPLAIDQIQSGGGNSAFPNSGDTPATSQADEILFGAFTFNGTNNGVVNSAGSGYTLAGPVVQPSGPGPGARRRIPDRARPRHVPRGRHALDGKLLGRRHRDVQGRDRAADQHADEYSDQHAGAADQHADEYSDQHAGAAHQHAHEYS